MIENRIDPPSGLRRLRCDSGGVYLANGIVGLLFAASGPVAIILSVGVAGGLSNRQIASWLFGVFFVNGILTILASWRYRQPLSFFWTIPGAVILGPSLVRHEWGEIIGAFIITGVLMTILGVTGLMRRAADAVPIPVVMGMVSGVFLAFGTDLVIAVTEDPVIAGGMVLAFIAVVVLSGGAAWIRRIPPIIAALAVGVTLAAATGSFDLDLGGTVFADPAIQAPQWSWETQVELVIPLAITVLIVQNGQGLAVLKDAGHDPPVNFITVSCGVWSLLTAPLGAVSTCLTGPVTGILAASGERSRQYIGGLVVGALAMVFGLFAPLFTDVMLGAPASLIAALAGLAMLRVLQNSFRAAFGGAHQLGGLLAFLVTVSGITLANVSSAFWGVVVGLLVAKGVERWSRPATG